LSNFDFIEYYKSNRLFGGVYSRDNLPKCKNKFYIVNFNKKHESGSHWVCVISTDCCYYFDSFGIHPPPEINRFMQTSGKKIMMNTFRVQALRSIMCGYFCVYMIDEMCKGREFYDVLLDFEPNKYNQNDEIVVDKLNLT
jgi:hypothetical protein